MFTDRFKAAKKERVYPRDVMRGLVDEGILLLLLFSSVPFLQIKTTHSEDEPKQHQP